MLLRWLPVLVLLVLPGCTDFEEDGANFLRIQAVDVSAPEVGSGRLTLAVNVTLDNSGGRSGAIELDVKAYDGETGLLVETSHADVGTIKADKTRHVEVLLELPRANSYRLQVELFEDGRLLREAHATAGRLSSLEPTLFDTGLRIATMDFLVQDTEGPRATIRTSIYLTNEGAEDSRPLSLQIKAREMGSGLLADEVWASVGAIPRDETRAFNGTLSLPQGYNYDVEAILWDGNVIVERGQGEVQFVPTTNVPEDQDVVVSEVDLEAFRTPGGSAEDSADHDDDAATPGFGVLAALAAVAAGAILVHRRRT